MVGSNSMLSVHFITDSIFPSPLGCCAKVCFSLLYLWAVKRSPTRREAAVKNSNSVSWLYTWLKSGTRGKAKILGTGFCNPLVGCALSDTEYKRNGYERRGYTRRGYKRNSNKRRGYKRRAVVTRERSYKRRGYTRR